jgi:chemotaxis response regulator CheB
MLLKKKQKLNLILLISLVMMSWKGFSQNDTVSSTIQLTKPVARFVIKDLVQFDGLTKEMQTMQEILKETNDKLNVQGDLVANLKTQVLNYQSQMEKKDNQLNAQKNATQSLQKSLKKERRKTKLYQIGSAIGGGAVLLLLIQN